MNLKFSQAQGRKSNGLSSEPDSTCHNILVPKLIEKKTERKCLLNVNIQNIWKEAQN